MNGRELTAEDVRVQLGRYTGLGSAYRIQPNIAQWSGLDDLGIIDNAWS